MRKTVLLAGFAGIIMFASAATTEVAAPAPKVEVRYADSVEYDGAAKTIEMVGAVHVVRGTMSIRADRIDITMNDDDKGVKKAVATGHVEIIDGARKALSDRAEFFEASSEIILTGSPKLWSDGNEIEADRIIYNTKTLSMKAAGKVRGLFIPGASF